MVKIAIGFAGLEGVNSLLGGGPGLSEVNRGCVDVIKQVGHALAVDGRRSRLARRIESGSLRILRRAGGRAAGPKSLNGKPCDGLRFVVVEQQEVFLFQVSDGVAMCISHDHTDLDQVHAHLEGLQFFMRAEFGQVRCGFLWGRTCRILRGL